MKAWTDLKSIATPECMQHLGKDARGYPIPYNVTRDKKGKPDFRVMDPVKWGDCVVYRKCALTGLPLGDDIAFVGGPMSMQSRLFADAGMLPEAAEYALQVCPFLAAPNFSYAEVGGGKLRGEAVRVDPAVSTTRPERFGLGITSSYQLAKNGEGVVILAGFWKSVVFYHHGKKAILNWSPK